MGGNHGGNVAITGWLFKAGQQNFSPTVATHHCSLSAGLPIATALIVFCRVHGDSIKNAIATSTCSSVNGYPAFQMITFSTAVLFFSAAVLLALTPGPDNLFVLAQSAKHGRKAGLLVTLGLCTGLVFHTAAVTLGVAAVIATSDIAFTALKIVGAGYLLYLAWGALRSSGAVVTSGNGADRRSSLQFYLRGVIMNASNPKVAIFFLALLPQFIDPTVGNGAFQIIQLGLLFMVATLIIFGGIAVAAGTLGGWLQRTPAAALWLDRIAGVVFISLALRLLLAQR
jgi:threonine/homoserine/homoserine lactone efflux protein